MHILLFLHLKKFCIHNIKKCKRFELKNKKVVYNMHNNFIKQQLPKYSHKV